MDLRLEASLCRLTAMRVYCGTLVMFVTLRGSAVRRRLLSEHGADADAEQRHTLCIGNPGSISRLRSDCDVPLRPCSCGLAGSPRHEAMQVTRAVIEDPVRSRQSGGSQHSDSS